MLVTQVIVIGSYVEWRENLVFPAYLGDFVPVFLSYDSAMGLTQIIPSARLFRMVIPTSLWNILTPERNYRLLPRHYRILRTADGDMLNLEEDLQLIDHRLSGKKTFCRTRTLRLRRTETG